MLDRKNNRFIRNGDRENIEDMEKEENKPSDSEGSREKLAEERTFLAKSRTMQSFVRTGIALLAIGITVLKLFESTLSISLLGLLWFS